MKKVCVYAICKDEEQFVERWYNSVKEADVIVVGDTGSSDNSILKLKEFGVTVQSINITPWRFDDARNAAMDLIPEDVDICVSIDMDEVFEPGWREKIENAWKDNTTRLKYNFVWGIDENEKSAISFIRDQIHQRKGYRWTHPIHEILEYVGDETEKIDYAEGVQVSHHPNPSKSRKQYLPLLELSVKENPEDDRNVHYLGREYMYYEKWDKSIETLKNHLNLKTATWKDERCASMRYISRCYQNKKDYLSAREWLYRAIIESPYTREPYVEMALLEHELRNFVACYHMCLEALKISNKNMNYINESFCWDSTIYDLCSVCCYNMELYKKAIEYSDQALNLNPNDERLLSNNKLMKEKLVE